MIAINYTGSLLDPTGYGEANRAFVAALFLAGVEVSTEIVVQTAEKINVGWEGELGRQLSQRKIPYKVKIIHLTPDVSVNYFENKCYHIQHLFWETDKLPQSWMEPLQQMDEIWTSSDQMVKLLKVSGIKKPCFVFPQPIDVTAIEKDYGHYSVPYQNGYLFYSIFQWIDRKNPKALLQTYWKTFEGVDDVTLLLKVFRFNYSDREFEAIKGDIYNWKMELGKMQFPKTFLIRKLMTKEEMMRFHSTGDCYIQTDRGEGWSRVVQEAFLMGKPVISTARGGIHEHITGDFYFRLKDKQVAVKPHPLVKYYEASQNWYDVDEDSLSKTMQYVYSHRDLVKAKGMVAQKYMQDYYNYFSVGYKMKKRLEEIYKDL